MLSGIEYLAGGGGGWFFGGLPQCSIYAILTFFLFIAEKVLACPVPYSPDELLFLTNA